MHRFITVFESGRGTFTPRRALILLNLPILTRITASQMVPLGTPSILEAQQVNLQRRHMNRPNLLNLLSV